MANQRRFDEIVQNKNFYNTDHDEDLLDTIPSIFENTLQSVIQNEEDVELEMPPNYYNNK